MKDANDPPLVGIVIVNWNGWRDTLDCLKSLEQSDYTAFLPILVDNASTDESVAMFQSLPNSVEVIVSPINGGWSGGNNLGIRRALDRGCDYIYLLNNDASICSATIAALIDIASDTRFTDYGILGSIVESEQPDEKYEFSGTIVDEYSLLPSGMGHPKDSPVLSTDVIPVAFAKGCSIFFHRSVVDRIGLIDDRFYLNYDETDFCYRARAAKILSGMCPRSKIIHKGGASIGGLRSPLSLYFLTRNQLLFAEKHFELRHRARLIAVTLAEIGKYKRAIAAASPAGQPILRLQREAVRRGAVDYMLRRFGNCPDRIREINMLYRTMIAVSHSGDAPLMPCVQRTSC